MEKGLRKPWLRPARRGLSLFNGAKRTRTADPLHAMQVLYQLSYGPKWYAWQQERWSFCFDSLRSRAGVNRAYNVAGPLHLAPHGHQLALHAHLVGRQHQRCVGRVGGLEGDAGTLAVQVFEGGAAAGHQGADDRAVAQA